jgi:hypothetical protein
VRVEAERGAEGGRRERLGPLETEQADAGAVIEDRLSRMGFFDLPAQLGRRDGSWCRLSVGGDGHAAHAVRWSDDAAQAEQLEEVVSLLLREASWEPADAAAGHGTPSLRDELSGLYGRLGPMLSELGWTSERDRLSELVFAIVLVHGGDEDVTRARKVVAILDGLGLVDPRALAQPDAGEAAMTAAALERNGFAAEAVAAIVDAFAAVGMLLLREGDGKVQRLLRKHAQEMVSTLVGRSGLDRDDARQGLEDALVLWLQNTLSMPLSRSTPAVRRFCETRRITPDQLLDASDELDLNVAVVDDLLMLAEHLPAD